ncbi:MAG: hypothetical protein DME65_04855 [Verrucomicrobia bacterium]|nr:MAG: hypothetical protein DME65_04855 [Verrucomicrobiota bacterium]
MDDEYPALLRVLSHHCAGEAQQAGLTCPRSGDTIARFRSTGPGGVGSPLFDAREVLPLGLTTTVMAAATGCGHGRRERGPATSACVFPAVGRAALHRACDASRERAADPLHCSGIDAKSTFWTAISMKYREKMQ